MSESDEEPKIIRLWTDDEAEQEYDREAEWDCLEVAVCAVGNKGLGDRVCKALKEMGFVIRSWTPGDGVITTFPANMENDLYPHDLHTVRERVHDLDPTLVVQWRALVTVEEGSDE